MQIEETRYPTMPHQATRAGLTLRDAYDAFLDGSGKLADLVLGGFLLQHCLNQGVRSVASIGIGSDAEFQLLNALADESGNFVYLNPDPRARQRLNDLVGNLDSQGFGSRVLMADLTLPARWPDLIGALSLGEVRILGLDAGWAASDPDFWSNLSRFMRAADRVVYIRGALSYERPEASIEFLRTMPAESGLTVIAATSTSVWFAPEASLASSIRETLHRSGLFTAAPAGGPVIVHNEAAATLVDVNGRFPKAAYRISRHRLPDLRMDKGWSTPEDDGCWTDGEEARLTLSPDFNTKTLTGLRIIGNAWTPEGEIRRDVEFAIGHRPAAWTSLRPTEDEISEVWIDLQPNDGNGGEIPITVRPELPGRPSDHGGSDTRLLGFKLRSVEVFA